MASLVLRHGIYHLVWREAGRQKWRSLRTGDADTARAALRLFRRQLLDAEEQSSLSPTSPGVTLRAFLSGPYQDYAARKSDSTRATDNHRACSFLAAFGDRPLSSITRADVERWRASRRAKVSASTVNRDMALLRSIFARAVEYRAIEKSPCAGLKDYPVQERPAAFLEGEEIARLLSVCSGPLRLFVALSAHAGLRRGEVLALRWGDVDVSRRTLTVAGTDRATKNYRFRTVPINSTLFGILQEASERPAAAFVVPGRRDGFMLRDLRLGLRAALRSAGVTRHIRFHDLRHSFASNLVMAGVDIRTVSALLGHHFITTTMRYAHLTQDHLAGAVERIATPSASPGATCPMPVSAIAKKGENAATPGSV